MAPNARVWRMYFDEAGHFDAAMVESILDTVDVTLVSVRVPLLQVRRPSLKYHLSGWPVLRCHLCACRTNIHRAQIRLQPSYRRALDGTHRCPGLHANSRCPLDHNTLFHPYPRLSVHRFDRRALGERPMVRQLGIQSRYRTSIYRNGQAVDPGVRLAHLRNSAHPESSSPLSLNGQAKLACPCHCRDTSNPPPLLLFSVLHRPRGLPVHIEPHHCKLRCSLWPDVIHCIHRLQCPAFIVCAVSLQNAVRVVLVHHRSHMHTIHLPATRSSPASVHVGRHRHHHQTAMRSNSNLLSRGAEEATLHSYLTESVTRKPISDAQASVPRCGRTAAYVIPDRFGGCKD